MGAEPSAVRKNRADFARYKGDVKSGAVVLPVRDVRDTVMSLVVVLVIVALAAIWKWTSWSPHHDGTHQGLLGPEYTAPADPGTTSFVPRPDWYFYFLFYLLRIFKWPASVFLGTVGVPTIALILLIALPFYDRRRERRPSHRPLAMVGAVLVIISMAVLTWKGATASEALASEVITQVPHWIQANHLRPRRCRCKALRHLGLHGMPHVSRLRRLSAWCARSDGDRHAQPRHRLPDPPPRVPLVCQSGLADAEVRVARHCAAARPRGLLRGLQGPVVDRAYAAFCQCSPAFPPTSAARRPRVSASWRLRSRSAPRAETFSQ
jgi:hypothetical protein